MNAVSERQIRELLETRTRAFPCRDAATAVVAYDDLVLYDAVGPFVRRGEGPPDRLERWIALDGTGIGHERASVPFDPDTGHAVLRGEL